MKKCILSFIGATLLSIGVSAQTNLSSSFSSNTTLTVANSPYVVTNSINVNAGVTVTVEDGVEIRFNSGVYLLVYGILNATGTKFTANSSTTKGFWDGIYVSYEYSGDIGNVTLNNCTVEYASNLYTRNGKLTLKNSTLNNFSGHGVQISGKGTLDIDNTTIKNTNYPINFYGSGVLIARNNVLLTGNTNDYILLSFSDITSTFYMPNVGIPYYCNYLRVTETGTLNISPGTELKLMNCEMTIQGKIKALGTTEKPIIFDKHPGASYWIGLNLAASSIDTACIFKNCVFKNATYDYEPYVAVEITSASPTFENCKFFGNCRNLIVTGISKPVFTNCTFNPSIVQSGECYNVGMDMNSNLNLSTDSIMFNNKEIRAIKIFPSTVIDDSNLKQLSFKNLINPTYCLYGTTTIHDTASLIIDPGVVIKCRDYSSMITANGALNGIGTVMEPIIFTNIADDSFGNPLDSQNDGVQAMNHSSSGRIAIYGKTTSKIEYWKIHYGGYNGDNWAVYVSNGNIVKNCEIKNSYRGVYFSNNAQVLNNSFMNIDYYPLGRLVNQGDPVLIGNTVANVGNIGILIGTFANDSPILKPMDFAGFTNVAYIIESSQTIAAGNVVSIEPGVVIKFSSNGTFVVNGAIKALGKATNKIIFTSLKDDSASGDSNNNGTATVPASGDWNGIDFNGTASDTDNILKNCEVRYCGVYYWSGTKGAIRITDCRLTMDSTKINFSNSCALGIYGDANPIITNNLFYNLSNAPVSMDMFANPTFAGNKIANAPRIGLLIRGQDIKGTIPVRSFEGIDTITYIMEENMTVTGQLVIPAGLTFKGQCIWYIKGKVDIQGTAQKPVVFTTQEDDMYGNPKDLQQNGKTNPTNAGGYFVFYDESNDNSTIDHTIFRYSASTPIQLTNASPKILNSTFENLAFPGLSLTGSSAPTLNGCTFNNILFPFTTSLVTYPVETIGNTITGTTARAIRITDETLTQDVTLVKRSFAGIVNIPYLFQNYTVGTGAKLTVKPGIVCKFMTNGYMNIQNGLIAKGGSTTDSTIVFTSDRDDFYGGDTYADGDANPPTKTYWQGIYFLNESIDENCLLENCILKNGSYLYYYHYYPESNRGAITMNNASPTLKNCLFENNYYGIISLNTSLPKITNCDFVGTEPTNGYGILNNTATNIVTATGCWWNSNTGPKHASNPGGLGERVSDYVVFTPFALQLAKPVLGDVSMNGEVKPYDASLVLQHTVGNIALNAKQQSVADVSGNGVISSYDASLILQYSVGLISRFEPSGVKAATIIDQATISFPNFITEPTKKTFEIPVTVSTIQGIKALDMKYSINANYIKFLGINKDKIPEGITIETGFNITKGEIIISMASAYDLRLNNQQFVLEFEFLDSSSLCESRFNLTTAMANDNIITNLPGYATISNRNIISRIETRSGLNEPLIVSDFDGIHIKMVSEKASQNLHVQLFDLAGKKLYMKSLNIIDQGLQYINIPKSDVRASASGMYILYLKADDFSFTKKLLIK